MKSLRNWAIAHARKAEMRGRLEGMGESDDDVVRWPEAVASATVNTSSMA